MIEAQIFSFNYFCSEFQPFVFIVAHFEMHKQLC